MNAKQLIEYLSKLPQDSEVYYHGIDKYGDVQDIPIKDVQRILHTLQKGNIKMEKEIIRLV